MAIISITTQKCYALWSGGISCREYSYRNYFVFREHWSHADATTSSPLHILFYGKGYSTGRSCYTWVICHWHICNWLDGYPSLYLQEWRNTTCHRKASTAGKWVKRVLSIGLHYNGNSTLDSNLIK